MKQKLLELLNQKFLGKGVRKDGLEQLANSYYITVKTEEEAQTLVDSIELETVNEFVTEWRRSVDSEVNKGIETFKKNFKPEPPKPDDPKPQDPKPEPNDISEIIKNAVQLAVQPFQEKLNGYEKVNIEKQRVSILNEKLSTAPEVFKDRVLRDFNRMAFKDDEDFDAFITETETDLTTFNQTISDQANGAYRRPYVSGNSSNKDEPSKGVKDYVADKTGSESSLAGKALV